MGPTAKSWLGWDLSLGLLDSKSVVCWGGGTIFTGLILGPLSIYPIIPFAP